MNGLMSQAAAWWDGRTLRERRMLVIMGLAVAVVLVWLLVLRPIWAWREAAGRDRAVAEADLDLIRRVEGTESSAGESGGSVDLQAVVQQANTTAGVTPVMGMSSGGGLGFSLTNVSTGAAFGWLAALQDLKVEATSLSVVENADATISMEGEVAPAS